MQWVDNATEVLLRESLRQIRERKENAMLNGKEVAVAGAFETPAPVLAVNRLPIVPDSDNHNRPDVYRAICQVAKEISRDGVSKGRNNQQQGYAFRGIDDIYNALSALIAGADLCILPRMLSRSQEERPTKDGKGVLFYVTVHADFTFVSALDGSFHTVTFFGEAMDSADKATNKAMSAAYKYCMLQVFCIPTEGMQDADATTHQPAPKPVAAAPAPVYTTPGPPPSAVAQRPPAPWHNRGTMRQAFARIRERVGEVVYLDGLARYGATIDLQWRDSGKALDCYEWLVERAVA